MKILSVLALLVALGGTVAVAQSDMGNVQVSGSTYTTGVVQVRTSDSLTILQDSGDQVTILTTNATVGAKDHPVGTRVRVDFHVNSTGQAIADSIQGSTAGAIQQQQPTSEPIPAVAPAPAVVYVNTTPAPVVVTPAPTPPAYVETAATTTPPVARRELPATGSGLPLLGLLGLALLGGAVTVRLAR